MADDEEIAQLKARLAHLESTQGAQSSTPSKWPVSRVFKWIGLAILATIIAGGIMSMLDPQTDQQRAIASCIDDKGGGAWRGSSGITLENFCEMSVDYAILLKDRRENPEHY